MKEEKTREYAVDGYYAMGQQAKMVFFGVEIVGIMCLQIYTLIAYGVPFSVFGWIVYLGNFFLSMLALKKMRLIAWMIYASGSVTFAADGITRSGKKGPHIAWSEVREIGMIHSPDIFSGLRAAGVDEYTPTYLYFSKIPLTDARRGFIASRLQFFCQDENVIALDCENDAMVGKKPNMLNEEMLCEIQRLNSDLPDLMRLYKVYSGAHLLAYTNGESYKSYTKEMYENATNTTDGPGIAEMFFRIVWPLVLLWNAIYIYDIARCCYVVDTKSFYVSSTIKLVVASVLGIAYCVTIRGIKRRAAAALAGNDIR